MFELIEKNIKNAACEAYFVNRLNKEKSLANKEKRIEMLTLIAEHNLMLAVRIVNACSLPQKAETQIIWDFAENNLFSGFEQPEWKNFVENFAVPNGVKEYQVGDRVAIRCRLDGYVFTIRIVVSKDERFDTVTLSNGDILDATNLVDATYGRDKSYYYSFATDKLLAEFEHNLALVRQNNPLNQNSN